MENLHQSEEPLVIKLRVVIRSAIRLLAILMTLVIMWGVLDVGWVLYKHLMEPPFMMLTISDILDTFGAFMAVLIAVEIFINITIYLRDDVIHVKIVMATALMAIARKVIILDFDKLNPDYIYALAAVLLAAGISYWLLMKLGPEEQMIKIKQMCQSLQPDRHPGSDGLTESSSVQDQGRQGQDPPATAAMTMDTHEEHKMISCWR